MFERFTERSRQVVVLAQEEARTLKHNYIGTEHLLLGLLREEEGLAARVLESFDVTEDRVRALVIKVVGAGEEVADGQIPFTPRSKRILELALREALSLGHNYIGTEHILLAVARENEGIAMRILSYDFEVDGETIRNEVIRMLSGPGSRQRTSTVTTAREMVGGVPPSALKENLSGQEAYELWVKMIVAALGGRTREHRNAPVDWRFLQSAEQTAWRGLGARIRRDV